MKIKQCLLIAVILLAYTPTTNAQFGKLKKRAQNQLERKVDQKINQKIDKEVDKAVDSAFEEKEKDNPIYDPSKVSYETYELSGSYDYQFKIDWEITSKNDPVEMSQLLAEDGKHFAMEIHGKKDKENGLVIYDIEKSEMIILMESEKQAIITSPPSMEEQASSEKKKYTVTGMKKQILGYTCKQYTYSNDDGSYEVWITKDLKYSNYDLYSYMKQTSKRKKKQNIPASWEQIKDGLALESITIDKSGNKVRMIAKNIDNNANGSINVNGYKAMKITGMSKSGKE